MTKDEVIKALCGRGVTKDRASMYADVFLTYQEAQGNIEKNGAVVAHPRTAAPLVNPYLAIRDKAITQLRGMQDIDAAGLW